MKRALCIGINSYPGAQLYGCVNDANDWREALQGRGFSVETMLDEEATLSNIVSRVRSLIEGARYRDRIVITYSGHGTYRTDASGDEQDSRDEAICPVDCFTRGMLYDDEIYALMGMRRYGVRVLFVSDSCHSGTVNRFVGSPTSRVKFLPESALAPREKEIKPRSSLLPKPTLLMSGSKDSEFSWDAYFGPRPNGAFSRVALDTLAWNPATYEDWNRLIRGRLPSEDYPQTPMLQGSYYRRHWKTLA